jgi:hypothetical protein
VSRADASPDTSTNIPAATIEMKLAALCRTWED